MIIVFFFVITIRLIAEEILDAFFCPQDANADLISNINYPIAFAKFKHDTCRKVTRTVRNIADEEETVDTVTVDHPQYLDMEVIRGGEILNILSI